MRVWLSLLLAAVLAAGCGGGDAPDQDNQEGGAASVQGVEVTGSAEEKPTITIDSSAEPPEELVAHDLIEGDGEEAGDGASVTAHYVGVSWSTGEQFDSSWDSGQPVPFPLANVIEGWQEGIPGMKVGGRRLLIIPPDMAYGDDPPTPAIKPGETLVFVVDLTDVQ